MNRTFFLLGSLIYMQKTLNEISHIKRSMLMMFSYIHIYRIERKRLFSEEKEKNCQINRFIYDILLVIKNINIVYDWIDNKLFLKKN